MNQLTFAGLILSIALISGVFQKASGQGCSDAGFCSMGAMKPNQHYAHELNLRIHSVTLEQYYGNTKPGVDIFNTTLDLNIGITNSLIFQFKVPYVYTSGQLGKTEGIGDISYSFTQRIFSNDHFKIEGTIGGKAPTNKSNIKNPEGRPFPMYQQTSLGTWDLVAGASFLSENWLFSTGLQHPFKHQNNNQFFWGKWKESGHFEHSKVYNKSIELKRGTDIMFRLERSQRYKSFKVHLGLLSIGRLNKDITTKPKTDKRHKKEGTTGFAHNALIGLDYYINAASSINLFYALKLQKRKVNPDGLPRDYVSTISYTYKF